MARPKSDGLLYFPFDTDFFYADKKIKALRARYGCDGLVIYIYLLTEIYRNGYFIWWDEDSEDNMMADLNLSEGLIKQVIAFLISRSLLQSILVNSDTALTSPGIQKRYQEAVKGLKRDVFVREDLWLLKDTETATFIKFSPKYDKSEKNESISEKNESISEKNPTNEMKRNESNKNHCAPEPHENKADKDVQLKHDFEVIYDIYPKKRGKTVAFANYKQWVSKQGKNVGGHRYHLTNRQIYMAVKRYVQQQKEAGQDDYQYWKNFDTLMGRQLLDYVEWEDGED